MRRSVPSVALGLLLVVLTATAQEKGAQVDNPAYKNWAAFKAGTTVVLKQTVIDKSGDDPTVIDVTARPDSPDEQLSTYKLLQVSPDLAVVELVQTDIEPGMETEHAPVKITYRAKVDKKAAAGLSKTQVGSFKEGDEEVEVGGKKIKTHWVESEIKVENEVSTSKTWYSDAVPGGLVKQTTTKKQGGKVLFETTTVVVSFKAG